MYQLLTESKKNIQSYDISGTVGGKTITDANILKGSLQITNQCADENTFNLGGVYIGQLTCTFINVPILRNDWVGSEIKLSVTINQNETVPLGVWYVDTAEHTKGMTKVTAYDGMTKFDKMLENTSTINDTPYNILNWACTRCGATLGMSQIAVEALPNGTDTFFVAEVGDMETYRDVLYWLSQTLGGFATMNRDGYLRITTYKSSVDDTIDSNVRFNTSQYGDEVVTFSGFYWTDEEDGSMHYEHNSPDNGYYLTLGINPFLQSDARLTYIDGILETLEEFEFNACDVSIPFGMHYDLGDVLQFPNGQGSATNKFCVISYTWNYFGECRIKSLAVPKTSKSKTDKNVTSLMRRGSSDEINYYLISNISDITIADGSYADIIDMYFAAEKGTIVVFNCEIHLNISTTVSGDTYDDAVGTFELYLDNLLIADFAPIETWLDGNHIKHLLYYFTIQQAGTKQFRVRLNMAGGSAEIRQSNLHGAIYGQKLVASENWDGIFRIEDSAPEFNLEEITFESAAENFSFTWGS